MENRFLNEDALKELIRRLSAGNDPDAREDLKLVGRALDSFHIYVDTVVRKEGELLIGQSVLEGQEYRDTVSDYDSKRHSRHETAIGNAKLLNRVARLRGVDPVFTGDETQRHQIADFCLEVDQWLFRNRRMKLS